MPAGCPRTVSPPPEQLKALGQEMVEWFETTKVDYLHVSDWYCLHKGFTDKAWETMTDRAEFVPYYNKALKLVGRKYLAKDSPIEPSLKQRWQRVYFKDLRKEEDDTLRNEYELKSKVQENVNEKVTAGFEALMTQIGTRQSDKSALKSAENTISDDKKS